VSLICQGEGENGKVEATEDESEEAWRKRQHEPLMYHRLEATTRERKTAQVRGVCDSYVCVHGK